MHTAFGLATSRRRTNQDDNAPTNVLTLDDDDYVNKIDDAFTAQQMVSAVLLSL
mgnify:CR=1 FL=1